MSPENSPKNSNSEGTQEEKTEGSLEKQEQTTSPLEINEGQTEESFSYLSAILRSLKDIFLVCGSFDFSWGLVFLAILINHTSSNTSSDSEPNSLDVAALALTSYESIIVPLIAVFFALPAILGPMFAALNAPETKVVNDEPEPQDANTPLISKNKTLLEMSSVYQAGLLLSVPLIAAVTLPCIFSEPLLILLGQDPEVAAEAQRFLQIMAISPAPTLFRFLMEQFFMSANKFRVPLMIAGPSLLIGMGLAAFLTYGPPKLGLEGIAWGFNASAILSAIGFTFYGTRFEPFSKIPFYSQWNLKSILKKIPTILKIGLPLTGQYAGELIAGFALSVFAGLLGTNQLASWNFAQSLLFLTKIFQIASGVAAYSSFSLGNEKAPREARLRAYISAGVSLLPIALFTVPTMIEPKLAIWLFSGPTSPQIEATAREMLRIFAAALLVSAPNMIFMFVPKVKGDTWKPHVITISSIWAGTGGAYLLANQAKFGAEGLSIGYAAGVTVATGINGFRFFNTLHLPSNPPQPIEGYIQGDDEEKVVSSDCMPRCCGK